MRAFFRILVKSGLSVSVIRVSGAGISNPIRRCTRRRNATRLLAFSVRRSCPIDRRRSKHSARRNLQPDLIRIARWRSANGRSCEAARDPLQGHWRSRWRSRLALLVVHAPWSNAGLISCAPVIFSIVSVIFFAILQSSAQEISAGQAPLLTDNQTFQQIENRWSEAIDKRNQYALEQLLSPELIDISAIGAVTTRNQQIAMLFGKGAEPLSLNLRVINVRIFGDLAVVIGTYGERRRVNGKLTGLNGMFTHIFQNVRGNWLCVSAQRTWPIETVPQKGRGTEK